MGVNGSLILEDEPKKLEYLKKLWQYDQPNTIFEKAKTYIGENKTRSHSISKWAEILGSQKNNENTRDFLKVLAEKNALEKEGTRQNGNKTFPVYSVNKETLLKVFSNSKYYQWQIDLFIDTINKAEPDRKVITDF